MTKKIPALLLAVCLCVPAGCAMPPAPQNDAAFSQLSGEALSVAEAPVPESEPRPDPVPILVLTSGTTGCFNPFFAETAAELDVIRMTQAALLTTDRDGAAVLRGATGESRAYNGNSYRYSGLADIALSYSEAADRTVCTIRLREDARFSDGELLDADDLIFNYYVYCDPAYDGPAAVASCPIVGLTAYRLQTDMALYEEYGKLAAEIYEAGPGHAHTGREAWTRQMQSRFWMLLRDAWQADLWEVVEHCLAEYLDDRRAAQIGQTAAAIRESTGLQVAFAMWAWGFAEYENSMLTLDDSGTGWSLWRHDVPSLRDFYEAAREKYAGDPIAYFREESLGEDDPLTVAREAFIREFSRQDADYPGPVTQIDGIEKLDAQTVEITLEGACADAAALLCGFPVAPLHHYGNEALYDYENGEYGFLRGDLSDLRAKDAQPLGAGPYILERQTENVLYFRANAFYYKGRPRTEYIQFQNVPEGEALAALLAGEGDLAVLSATEETLGAIRQNNANGELRGGTLSAFPMEGAYGYLGLHAGAVRVEGDGSSEASRALRHALAVILALYREEALAEYFGDAAVPAQSPLESPGEADGAPAAFSTGPDGEALYWEGMSADARLEAALQAALRYFEAAGYTVENGKLVTAPAGARLTYRACVAAGADGRHPALPLLERAATALEQIGLVLEISVWEDFSAFWEAVRSGDCAIWAAAWESPAEADLYTLYHSGASAQGDVGPGNLYGLRDPQLDALLESIRGSLDSGYRRFAAREAWEIVSAWAVEVPFYRRQSVLVFRGDRLRASTLVPEPTAGYGWLEEVEKLERKTG